MTSRARRYAYEEALTAGIDAATIFGRSREAPICRARWRVMRRLRDDGFSLGQIGRALARHHTTVLAGLRK